MFICAVHTIHLLTNISYLKCQGVHKLFFLVQMLRTTVIVFSSNFNEYFMRYTVEDIQNSSLHL